jgi:RNA polymerase sigma-70 factor (ECF subfamily)
MMGVRLRVIEEKPMNWNRVWNEHRNDLYAYIYRRVRNPFDAEDMLQETFLKAFDSIRNRRAPPDNMAAFLKTVSRNLIIDQFRKKKRCPLPYPLEAALPYVSRDTVEDAVIRTELYAEMHAVIQTFPMHGRLVIEYRFFDDLSIKETARRMRASEPAIRSLQFRIIRKVRDRLHIRHFASDEGCTGME